MSSCSTFSMFQICVTLKLYKYSLCKACLGSFGKVFQDLILDKDFADKQFQGAHILGIILGKDVAMDGHSDIDKSRKTST